MPCGQRLHGDRHESLKIHPGLSETEPSQVGDGFSGYGQLAGAIRNLGHAAELGGAGAKTG